MARPEIKYTQGQIINGNTFVKEIEASYRRRALFICHCGNEFESTINHVKIGNKKGVGAIS